MLDPQIEIKLWIEAGGQFVRIALKGDQSGQRLSGCHHCCELLSRVDWPIRRGFTGGQSVRVAVSLPVRIGHGGKGSCASR